MGKRVGEMTVQERLLCPATLCTVPLRLSKQVAIHAQPTVLIILCWSVHMGQYLIL